MSLCNFPGLFVIGIGMVCSWWISRDVFWLSVYSASLVVLLYLGGLLAREALFSAVRERPGWRI
jgi:hypothetical protein